MTAKSGVGEAAQRKQRLKLLLPLLWYCLLSCAAQQQQKPLQSSIEVWMCPLHSQESGKSAHLYSLGTKPAAQIRHLLVTIRSVRPIIISYAICTLFLLKRLMITACRVRPGDICGWLQNFSGSEQRKAKLAEFWMEDSSQSSLMTVVIQK